MKKENKYINSRHNYSNFASGITLIALVITIIVLLILAGVTISMVLGDNGIIKQAESGGEKYKEESIREKVELALGTYTAQKYSTSPKTFSEVMQSELEATPSVSGSGYSLTYNGYTFSINDKYKITGMQKTIEQLITGAISNVAVSGVTGLQISNQSPESYSNRVVLNSSNYSLNTISTNSMTNGFQKINGFIGNSPQGVSSATETDYFKQTFRIKSDGQAGYAFITGIDYADSNGNSPISTALRVGLVVNNQEYIFSLNQGENPQRSSNINTLDGNVIDSFNTDGTRIPFELSTSSIFANYDSGSGSISLTQDSMSIFQVLGNENTTQVDLYVWLEGCDIDCVANLNNSILGNLEITFGMITDE